MNLELTAEQLALRDSVRRFLASTPDRFRPVPDGPADLTDLVSDGLARLGVTGLVVPEKYGGAAATMLDAGVVLEELGRVLDPGPWLWTAVAVPRTLVRLGITDEAAELLSGIADGSTTATIGLHRAHAPSVVAARHDGTVTLRGHTTEVPDAAAVHILLVFARDGDGISLYAVETTAASLSMTPIPTADRAHQQFNVTFTDTPAWRLGDAPAKTIDALIDDVLIAASADALGAAQRILELTVEHAKVRTQFGRPIGSFQAVQHLCVDMFETVELARGGVMHGLWAADAAPDEERHLAAIRIKAFAGQLATVGETAIQIFGGIGFTWEHDAHFYLERLLNWSAFLGGPDRYLREIGSHLARTATIRRSTP